jgi:hypothetical protein
MPLVSAAKGSVRQKFYDPAEINKNEQIIVGIEQSGNECCGWVLTGGIDYRGNLAA